MRRRFAPDEKVRVALIGAGGWGSQHARVFAAHPNAELCAVAGRTPERTEARAREFGIRAYTNIQQMLEQEKPDLVSLSLPNQEHFEPTLTVIEAGCHLLVEKPLTFDLCAADALLAGAQERNLFFAINFNHRYSRPHQMAKNALEAGRLGEIVFATWRFGGEGRSNHPHANLIETQCHGFDLLEWLCGPIESVMAEMTDKTGGGWRTVALSLRFVNGGVATLLGSYDSSYAYPNTHLLEINGTQGRVVVEDTVRRYSFHSAGSEIGETWESGYFNDRDREFQHTFDAHISDLLTAFRAGHEPPIHARAGRRALLIAHSAIRSFETGMRVAIPEPV